MKTKESSQLETVEDSDYSLPSAGTDDTETDGGETEIRGGMTENENERLKPKFKKNWQSGVACAFLLADLCFVYTSVKVPCSKL